MRDVPARGARCTHRTLAHNTRRRATFPSSTSLRNAVLAVQCRARCAMPCSLRNAVLAAQQVARRPTPCSWRWTRACSSAHRRRPGSTHSIIAAQRSAAQRSAAQRSAAQRSAASHRKLRGKRRDADARFDARAPPLLGLCRELAGCMGSCVKFRQNGVQARRVVAASRRVAALCRIAAACCVASLLRAVSHRCIVRAVSHRCIVLQLHEATIVGRRPRACVSLWTRSTFARASSRARQRRRMRRRGLASVCSVASPTRYDAVTRWIEPPQPLCCIRA